MSRRKVMQNGVAAIGGIAIGMSSSADAEELASGNYKLVDIFRVSTSTMSAKCMHLYTPAHACVLLVYLCCVSHVCICLAVCTCIFVLVYALSVPLHMYDACANLCVCPHLCKHKYTCIYK